MKNLINIIEKLKVNSKSQVNNDWSIEDAKDGDIIISKYNIVQNQLLLYIMFVIIYHQFLVQNHYL